MIETHVYISMGSIGLGTADTNVITRVRATRTLTTNMVCDCEEWVDAEVNIDCDQLFSRVLTD